MTTRRKEKDFGGVDMNKSENMEYKTLEQQIMALWKSRGMEVQTIQFQVAAKSPAGDTYEWIIHAKRKMETKDRLKS